MTPAPVTVSVEEYLRTSFEGVDREFVDGEVVERAIPDIPHSETQVQLGGMLRMRYPQYRCGSEVRWKVGPNRYRIPDLLVWTGEQPQTKFVSEGALLAIEIMSPEDSAAELDRKIDEYLAAGVRAVWILDPRDKRARIFTPDQITQPKDRLTVPGTDIALALSEVWEQSIK
jgi:Uma2 family endonuclease